MAIEEAVWAGDRVAEGVMKDLKTSLRINNKLEGIAEFSAANHCRFVILGNPKWLIAAPEDDRRDTVYQFADGNKGKTKTFAAMWAEMEGGGFRALLRDLKAINLKTVTIKGAPLDLREPYADGGADRAKGTLDGDRAGVAQGLAAPGRDQTPL